jgi:hypothetical protein
MNRANLNEVRMGGLKENGRSSDVLEAMQSLIKQDIIVCAHEIDVFWKRIKWIERKFSHKMICEHFPVSVTA